MSNLPILKIVAKGLEPIIDKIVFVGGSVVELYADQICNDEIRATLDIDCIIELTSYSEYNELEKLIRTLGFKNDIESGVICRWIYHKIIIDIMPNDENILGFSNPWYSMGIKTSIWINPYKDLKIKILTAPFFIATKIVAFIDRGKYHFRTSHDFEDIVFILNNRSSIFNEILNAPIDLKKYIVENFNNFVNNDGLREGIFCALSYNATDEDINKVFNIFSAISKL